MPLWKRLPNGFSLAVIALMVGLYVMPFGDLDFAILIRLGGHILETGQLRPPEGFSYTIAGQDVPDFEWIFELFSWGIWTIFGFGGLKLFKVVLVATTLGLVAWRLHDEGVRWHGIALSLGLAVLLLAPSWNLRPLYFTTIGLLLVSWALHDHCTGKRPLSWWVPIYMLLWANIHPGVITGQGLLLGAIGWEWLNRWVKLNTPLTVKECWRLTLIGGLGIAATFVSPDPVERMLLPLHPHVRDPIFRTVVEMRPLYQAALEPYYQLMLAYVLALLVLVTVVLRFRHYRLWEIALLLGTAGLANVAVRNLQDWVLVMLSLGVPHFARLLRHWSRQDRRRWWVAALLRCDRTAKRMLLSPMFRWQRFWPLAGLGVLAVVSLIPAIGRDMPLQTRESDPVRAVQWIEEKGLAGEKPWKIFAHPDYGTYVVWKLYPAARCYVDTRGFSYPVVLTEDAHYIPQLGPDWQARLERVLKGETQYFLLETTGARGNLWHLLKEHKAEHLYLDEQTVLLEAAEVYEALARWQEQQAMK
jgi:hypothetical protein